MGSMTVVSEVIVRRCIGCGGVDNGQACRGTCAEHRLDLVESDAHAAAEARLAAAEDALASFRGIAARLARGAPPEWGALRAQARAALRSLGDPAEGGAAITAWACDSCGRIEAPQPCIGVCIRPETPMVEVAEHQAVLARDAALRDALVPFAALARALAWSTPRPGQSERSVRVLCERARGLVEK